MKHGDKITHVGRGSNYTVMATGNAQCSTPIADGDELTAYRGPDGRWWFRPVAEMEDGRFTFFVPPVVIEACATCEDGKEVPMAARPYHCMGCGIIWHAPEPPLGGATATTVAPDVPEALVEPPEGPQ
jgi:hypothetical protein